MRGKRKYLGAIGGTLVGFALAWNIHHFGAFWVQSPVPLAILGYAIGALSDDGETR